MPHWVVVHGVDGVAPGVYRWPDLYAPLRTGDLRDELLRICLDQALAGRRGVRRHRGDLGRPTLDDRSYRDAQLAAGLVEGRLHLAAYALGASASGMTFLDSEVPGLLGEPDDLATLLFTCVGVPEYTSRAGGGPGAPVRSARSCRDWPARSLSRRSAAALARAAGVDRLAGLRRYAVSPELFQT